MDMEHWELQVTFGQKPCGTAKIWKEGLYYRFFCDCEAVTDQIVRAYVDCNGISQCLGVFLPEGNRLQLSKRLPVANLPQAQFRAVVMAQSDLPQWQSWSGRLFEQEVTEALCCTQNGQTTIAIPFSLEEPFPHMPIFCLLTPLELAGKRYLSVLMPE